MPLPNTFGEREQAAEFTHPILVFPPAERAIMRWLVKIKHGEDLEHLVEVVFSVTETLLQFIAEQNQYNLRSLCVPVCAIRRGGYVGIVNVLFGKVSTHPSKPSERDLYHQTASISRLI